MRNVGHARRRLAVALGLSMLLHAWLMESHYGKGAARSGAGGVPLAARILPAAAATKHFLPEQATAGVVEHAAPIVVTAPSRSVPPVSADAAGAARGQSVTDTAAAPVQPSDPTYYAAGDLDVFPRALATLDLSAALNASHAPGTGTVRATVLIDEAGVVNAVRGVEVSAGDSAIGSVARELLLRARFTPARNKEGRIVKAQVLVALDYDTRVQR